MCISYRQLVANLKDGNEMSNGKLHRMNTPNVSNPIKDAKGGVIYDILACRTLTRAERVMSVRQYLSHQKKKSKSGTKVTIVSIIGFDDSTSV